jgi:hypothetical protein
VKPQRGRTACWSETLTRPGRPGSRRDAGSLRRLASFWRDWQIAQGETFRVDLPEMSSDVSGRHAVFSTFDYASAA